MGEKAKKKDKPTQKKIRVEVPKHNQRNGVTKA